MLFNLRKYFGLKVKYVVLKQTGKNPKIIEPLAEPKSDAMHILVFLVITSLCSVWALLINGFHVNLGLRVFMFIFVLLD